MKILKITYEWPPPWEGMVAHAYELTKSQTKLGHVFRIFSGIWPRHGRAEVFPGVDVMYLFGNHTLPFRAPVAGTLLVTCAPILFFRYIFFRSFSKNAVDLIHCHGHFALWIYVYRNLLIRFKPTALELKTPLVVHFHNTVAGRWQKIIEHGGSISQISKYLDWPLARISDKCAVKIADALIFVSTDTYDEAIKYYDADPKKCYVVETGVNPELFVPVGQEEKNKIHKDFGIEPTDKVILNVGMLVERKNIHLLVEALVHLPDFYKLLLVGPFPDSAYEERIDKFIRENHLEKRVLKGGVYDYPEIPIIYQSADVFLLPSSFEGLPKVVMESLACGVPVIASGFKVSEEISGLFYLQDVSVSEIVSQIKNLHEKPAFVDRGKVAHLYSWDSRALAVEQIYKKISNKYKISEN